MTAALSLPVWQDLSAAERRDIIKPLWLAGLSATQICGHFHGFVTRNAVIGVIHRSRKAWGLRPARPSKPAVRRTNPVKRRVPNSPHIDSPVKRKPAMPDNPPDDMPDLDAGETPDSVRDMIDNLRPPIAGTTPISIMDLPHRVGIRCRFLVVGGYCGVPSGDHMYCRTHHRIAYTGLRGVQAKAIMAIEEKQEAGH
jgi:hypothetical protein